MEFTTRDQDDSVRHKKMFWNEKEREKLPFPLSPVCCITVRLGFLDLFFFFKVKSKKASNVQNVVLIAFSFF